MGNGKINNDKLAEVNSDGKKVSEGIEKIPSELVKNIPEIIHLLESNIISRKSSYEGPLPIQILENLSDKQRDKIIDDMIETNKRQFVFQDSFLKEMKEEKKEKRKHELIKMVFFALLVAGIYVFSVITQTSNILKDFLPYFLSAFGGGGIAVIYLYPKINKNPEKNGSDEE